MENKKQNDLPIDTTIQVAAIDIKVVALTSLLIDKGLITEEEVIQYTQNTKDAFANNLDQNHANTKKDKSFLDSFFKDYK